MAIGKESFRGKPFHLDALIPTETEIKSGKGILHRVVINKAGTSVTIKLRDGPAGSLLAEVDGAALGSYIYDIGFNNGLAIEVDGTTAPDATIVYT